MLHGRVAGTYSWVLLAGEIDDVLNALPLQSDFEISARVGDRCVLTPRVRRLAERGHVARRPPPIRAEATGALEKLGLPDPEHVTKSDPELGRYYRKFVAGFWPTDAGAITVDGDDLALAAALEGDDGALRLAAAILRPGPRLVRQIAYWASAAWTGYGVENEDVARFGSRVLRARKALSALALAPTGRYGGAPILRVSGEVASAPGFSWLTRIEVIPFDDRYGLVLLYRQAGHNDEDEPDLPRALGFVPRLGIVEAVGVVLESSRSSFWGSVPDVMGTKGCSWDEGVALIERWTGVKPDE